MVNWVEAHESLVHYLIKKAGLRQHAVDVDDGGTVISFWVPKKKAAVGEITPEADSDKPNKQQNAKKEKPSVVLVHGFAANGIMTWQLQVGALAKHYDLYVPDLLYFGGSTSPATDRSVGFQAECLVAALRKLGVERCTVVGFCYGAMMAFKMAEAHPDLVRSLVVSGSVIAMTESFSEALLKRLRLRSLSELLLPESVEGLRALFSRATYRKLWLPRGLCKNYLKVMFTNRKERAELLEGLIISDRGASAPVLPQKILLLWGENDNHFSVELAKTMKEQLGEKTTLQSISKAGHLAHVERPCVYNRRLKEFLAEVNAKAPME